MKKEFYNFYIGTNSVRGSLGIYSVSIDCETSFPKIISTSPIYNSGSLALSPDGKNLYSAVEGMTFQGMADGGVVAYNVEPGGKLIAVGGQPSCGQRTCCVAVDPEGKQVYAANFYQGTLTFFERNRDGTINPAMRVIRPEEKAPLKALHCVAPVEKDFVGVISLTECALIIYRKDTGERVTAWNFEGHPFPRYFETVGKYIYAMMQMPDDIYVFESHLSENGSLKLIQKTSLLPQTCREMRAASTIRATPDGKLVLAANRPTNSITVFKRLRDGRLDRRSVCVLPGEVPRDFNISQDGQIVVTALQKSDQICVHRIDYENMRLGPMEGMVSIPSPAAVSPGRRMEDG